MFRIALVAGLLAMTNAVHAADALLHASLQRVAHERVFFGHQSVGAQILQGVKELSAKEGVPVFIKDKFVPENGDPLRKLESFKAFVGTGSKYDVALVKFCYVDINADTDAAALFDQYRRAINDLRASNPRTVFVHATLPLTTVQTGLKAWVKRALGRSPYGTVENVRRDEYNRLLRATYAGREPIFDLARIESTAPDGTLVSVTWEGITAPALSPEYTTDGGHLNASGRLLAAREFLAVLAQASSQKIGGLAAATR
ncbi:MAG: hypothetical protein JOZ85_14105 [Betaproteobacteria bacterium]|nr:hypothetical protein [Betaproteobacteria bacterium]